MVFTIYVASEHWTKEYKYGEVQMMRQKPKKIATAKNGKCNVKCGNDKKRTGNANGKEKFAGNKRRSREEND